MFAVVSVRVSQPGPAAEAAQPPVLGKPSTMGLDLTPEEILRGGGRERGSWRGERVCASPGRRPNNGFYMPFEFPFDGLKLSLLRHEDGK